MRCGQAYWLLASSHLKHSFPDAISLQGKEKSRVCTWVPQTLIGPPTQQELAKKSKGGLCRDQAHFQNRQYEKGSCTFVAFGSKTYFPTESLIGRISGNSLSICSKYFSVISKAMITRGAAIALYIGKAAGVPIAPSWVLKMHRTA